MNQLIIQLFGIFAPIVRQIIEDSRAETGTDPTDEEVIAKFNADIDKYLAEGMKWNAEHPPQR